MMGSWNEVRNLKRRNALDKGNKRVSHIDPNPPPPLHAEKAAGESGRWQVEELLEEGFGGFTPVWL